jgi:hypothetical protein
MTSRGESNSDSSLYNPHLELLQLCKQVAESLVDLRDRLVQMVATADEKDEKDANSSSIELGKVQLLIECVKKRLCSGFARLKPHSDSENKPNDKKKTLDKSKKKARAKSHSNSAEKPIMALASVAVAKAETKTKTETKAELPLSLLHSPSNDSSQYLNAANMLVNESIKQRDHHLIDHEANAMDKGQLEETERRTNESLQTLLKPTHNANDFEQIVSSPVFNLKKTTAEKGTETDEPFKLEKASAPILIKKAAAADDEDDDQIVTALVDEGKQQQIQESRVSCLIVTVNFSWNFYCDFSLFSRFLFNFLIKFLL